MEQVTNSETTSAGVDRETLFPVLRMVTIFAGISEEGLRGIFDKCTIRTFAGNDEVVRENTAATDIYIILRGRVKLVLGTDEEPLELIELGTGNCFGEASVIGIQNHSATVVAVEPSVLLVLSRRVLMQIMTENQQLFSLLILNIARELARRLHYSDEVLLRYTRKKPLMTH
ncbi:MAG: cyclic nucleotide-binding domain-containing protein [Chitinivibrionales bacterium]